MMEFTKEELTLIEQRIDVTSAEHQKAVMQMMSLPKENTLAHAWVTKNFEDYVDVYDKLRTISAKCAMMKGEIKDVKKT